MRIAILAMLALLLGATACMTPDIIPGVSAGIEYDRESKVGAVGFDFDICKLAKEIELPGLLGTAFGFATGFLDCDKPTSTAFHEAILPLPASRLPALASVPLELPVDPDDIGS